MKISIATEKMKSAVSKVIKAAGNNNLMPITSMIGIKVEQGTMKLSCTDNTNTLEVLLEVVHSEDMSITVGIDTFSKLIAKTTSENIVLEVEENNLKISGNGEYKIPLVIDEEGVVEFPFALPIISSPYDISLPYLISVNNANKAALAKTLEDPFLTGYYFTDKVISTDREVICFNNIKVFNEDLLLNQQAINLIVLSDGDKVSVSKHENKLMLSCKDMILYTSEMEGKQNYPVTDIMEYVKVEFPSKCTVTRGLLVAVLDRLSLFLDPYDKNGAYFNFTAEGLTIQSKHSSSIETIRYLESTEFSPFACCVDIPAFKEQIDSIALDKIEIHYGIDNAIKITCGAITQIISLLEDDAANE